MKFIGGPKLVAVPDRAGTIFCGWNFQVNHNGGHMDEQYEFDEDGYRREVVGPWVEDKHLMLRHYIDAARGARGKMKGTHCLIDLYCGPGKSKVRSTSQIVPGGTIAAMESSMYPSKGIAAPFGKVIIGDLSEENVWACKARLESRFDVDVQALVGPAEETVHKAVQLIPNRGINLAYLDPYALQHLPFSIIEALALAPRVDLLIHFAATDMSRNLERPDLWGRFDRVAPGWRQACAGMNGKSVVRQRFFAHWLSLFGKVGYQVSEHVVPIKNSRHREIYRLVQASKHRLADNLWRTLRRQDAQEALPF